MRRQRSSSLLESDRNYANPNLAGAHLVLRLSFSTIEVAVLETISDRDVAVEAGSGFAQSVGLREFFPAGEGIRVTLHLLGTFNRGVVHH
jgi:hypothetical protein